MRPGSQLTGNARKNKVAKERFKKKKQQDAEGSKCFTLQSNQCSIEKLQVNIKACGFELGQFCLEMTHIYITTDTGAHFVFYNRRATSVHLHVSRVFVSAAGVGHDVQVALVRLCHDKVVHDPAFLIGEEGQRTLRKCGWLEVDPVLFFFVLIH